MKISDKINWEKGHGLAPAVVQHAITGRVLMLGYMSRESLEVTEQTNKVTFYSRTRQTLWTKGETSGNTLHLHSVELDCDHDALLVQAHPAGPTCHLKTNSCFDDTSEVTGFGFLGKLEQVIDTRIEEKSESSYTAQLVAKGTQKIAQKVGEEGVEVALAATNDELDELICESADLVFHLLVLLKHKGLSLQDVSQKLSDRHGESQ